MLNEVYGTHSFEFWKITAVVSELSGYGNLNQFYFFINRLTRLVSQLDMRQKHGEWVSIIRHASSQLDSIKFYK